MGNINNTLYGIIKCQFFRGSKVEIKIEQLQLLYIKTFYSRYKCSIFENDIFMRIYMAYGVAQPPPKGGGDCLEIKKCMYL